jgi:hypothetical protein
VPTGPAPTLIAISPQSGTIDGGTAVKLTGTSFVTGATVTFGSSAATGVDVIDASTITALTPAHSAGETQVTVTNPDKQSATLSGALTPLTNPGFESGSANWVLLGSGGSVNFGSNSANAHSGTGYAELSTAASEDHPVLYAADSSGSAEYFPVNPGDIITFGGWGYHVSGNGKARWGLEVSDHNKENKIYYSAEPFNVKVSTWVNFQSSYTVPIGVSYVRFYCEAGATTEPTVDRFDDAYLQIDIPGAGFDYVAETAASGPPPTLSSITPQSGSIAGGTSVTLGGQNFLNGATVTFDGSAATGVQVVDSSTIMALTPPHGPGESNVTVTNPDGQSSTLIGNISPLLNPGFELGSVNWQLLGAGGAATIQNNSANARSGSYYAELNTSAATDHPVFYAADANNVAQYVSVNPGDVITFGGWGYHVSGDGRARWGLEVSDANKKNASYISAAPYNVTASTWTYFESTYTVPAGMAFVRFYCEIGGSSGASDDRFDDAFLQVDIPGGGYDYFTQAPSDPPAPTLNSITPQSGSTAE